MKNPALIDLDDLKDDQIYWVTRNSDPRQALIELVTEAYQAGKYDGKYGEPSEPLLGKFLQSIGLGPDQV